MVLLYRLSQKRGKPKAREYLTFLGICSVGGISFLYFNADGSGIVIGPLLILTALAYLIAFINVVVKSLKLKAIIEKSTIIEVERMKSTDGIVKLEFSDEDFHYQDGDYEIRVKWNLIKSHLLMDGHLFLLLNNTSLSSYAISELDVGLSEFNEISNFVMDKLDPHDLSPSEQKKHKNNDGILDS